MDQIHQTRMLILAFSKHFDDVHFSVKMLSTISVLAITTASWQDKNIRYSDNKKKILSH